MEVRKPPLTEFQTICRNQLDKLLEGDDQKDALAKCMLDQHTLIRFLMAHDKDFQKAFYSWRNCLLWRYQSKLHKLTDYCVMNSLKSGKAIFFGQDRSGHPILLIRPRFHIPRHCDNPQKMRHLVWLMERGSGLADKAEGLITVLWDHTGFSKRANLDYSYVQLFIEAAKICQMYYPERLAKFIVHQPSLLFKTSLLIIKQYLSPATYSKIEYTNTPEQLWKHFEPEYLPQQLGGKAKLQYKYEVKDEPNDIVLNITSEIPNLQNYSLRNFKLLQQPDQTLANLS